MTQSQRFETMQLHAGQVVDKTTGARAVPIYQTTSYVFDSADHAADLFALQAPGNIYTRIMNPTTDVLEKRIAALEGGIAALATASGQAAITYAILNIAEAGDNIVAASTLYGGTHNLFALTLPKMGVTVKFVDPHDPDHFAQAIDSDTKAVFVESIGNPGINLVDFEAIAAVAHHQGIPLIVDNTFGTPYLVRPLEHGADIVVHSATKYIGGHGTTIGGLIVDGGRFDWTQNDRFPGLTEPDPSYNGISYAATFADAAYITKCRVQLLRDTGAALSPFNAFLLLQGMETLSLRVERHVANARRTAAFLQDHPQVSWVNYPELAGSPYADLASRYFPKGVGAIFTFGVAGGADAGRALMSHLQLFSLLANVADAKSLIIHPASTTHAQLSPKERQLAGVNSDMVRISVGLEHIDDILADLDQALQKI